MANNEYPKGIEIVSSSIIENDGKILLARSPKWTNKWTLPGGHIEPGETILEAGKREVKEELGLNATPVKIINFGELINSKDFHRPAHFIYFDILFDIEDTNVKLLEEELSDYGWFTIDEALKLDLAESFDETLIKYKEFLENK
jgi:nucleoside triphosphatase